MPPAYVQKRKPGVTAIPWATENEMRRLYWKEQRPIPWIAERFKVNVRIVRKRVLM